MPVGDVYLSGYRRLGEKFENRNHGLRTFFLMITHPSLKNKILREVLYQFVKLI